MPYLLHDVALTYLELDAKYYPERLNRQHVVTLVGEFKKLQDELSTLPPGYSVSDLVAELEFLRPG